MFRFSHSHGFGHGGRHHAGGPRGRRPDMDPERFFHWIERLNEGDRPRRGGRGPRMFDGGELRLVLLKLIADEPRHGYELIKAIEELTGGAYAPSPGVVYPTLTLLDEMELIAQQASEGARKRFAVTEAGQAHLAEQAETVATLMARLEAIGAHRSRDEGSPVRRSMMNLRQAVQNRIGHGEIAADTLHDIAALIDEVAQKIERLR